MENRGQDDEEVPEELVKLRSDNSRLRYRLNILQTAAATAAESGQEGCMKDVRGALINMFQQAVCSAYPALPSQPPCPVVPSAKGVPQIEVTFNLDTSNALRVTANDLQGQRSRALTVKDKVRLS